MYVCMYVIHVCNVMSCNELFCEVWYGMDGWMYVLEGRLFLVCVFVLFFSGWVAFWLCVSFVAFHFASSAFTIPLCLAFAAFYWGYAAFALAFRILCITSSSPAGGFSWLWLFASFAFPVGFWPSPN